MALFPLGILSAAGSDTGGTYELIQTQILGSATSSVVFDVSSFSSTYNHLQIRSISKSNFSGSWAEGFDIRFNSDSATNYSSHLLFGTGSAVQSGSAVSSTAILNILTRGAELAANPLVFGPVVVDILDAYSTTKNKTTRAFSGTITGTTAQNQVRLSSGLWRNTASITSITITPNSATSWVTGSRFSIYGIKG
jgi:hypothetical protein